MIMSMMGCLGVWVTDDLSPVGDYISIYCATDRTLSMALHTTDDYFYIDWGDGVIKQYAGTEGISGDVKFVNGGNTIKIYNVSNFNTFNVRQIDSLSDVDLITSLSDIDLGTNDTNINYLSATWPLTQIVLRTPNATDITILPVWDLSSLDIVNAPALTTINTSDTWVNLTRLDIDGGAGGVLSSFTAHAEWVSIQWFHVTNMALTEVAVNAILIALDATGMSGCEIDISGGTSSAPTGLGATAKTNLQGRGNTVNTN